MQGNTKSITVVIVNYNAGDVLSKAVKAALASTEQIKVIVVDNNSTDNSMAFLQTTSAPDERIEVIHNTHNTGFSRANNIVLRDVSSRYIVLLNPDCVVRPDTLSQLVTTMDADPSAGMAGCMVRNLDGTEQRGTRRNIPTPWTALVSMLHLGKVIPGCQGFVLNDQPLPEQPVYVEAISGALMLVRKSAMDDVGLLDEGYFLHCEDLDWFIRFANHGWKIIFDPSAEAVHVGGACSAARPVRVLWHKHRSMVRFYKKFFRNEYSLPLMWAVVAGVWARFMLLATANWLRAPLRRATP